MTVEISLRLCPSWQKVREEGEERGGAASRQADKADGRRRLPPQRRLHKSKLKQPTDTLSDTYYVYVWGLNPAMSHCRKFEFFLPKSLRRR